MRSETIECCKEISVIGFCFCTWVFFFIAAVGTGVTYVEWIYEAVNGTGEPKK